MRRSPREKKRLSYAKDCRNTYGENDKASRENLPRKRARVHRANRHHAQQTLHAATGRLDPDLAEATEVKLRGHRPHAFRKWPDTPLGEYLSWRDRSRG